MGPAADGNADVSVPGPGTPRTLAASSPEPVSAILRHIDLPHTAPRLSPARAPPQAALGLDTDPIALVDPAPTDDFDLTPAFDPADPETVPQLDLDQTRGA